MTTRSRTPDDRTVTTGTRITDTGSEPMSILATDIIASQQVLSGRSFLWTTGLRILTNTVELFGTVVLYTPAVRVVGNPLKPVVAGPIPSV